MLVIPLFKFIIITIYVEINVSKVIFIGFKLAINYF